MTPTFTAQRLSRAFLTHRLRIAVTSTDTMIRIDRIDLLLAVTTLRRQPERGSSLDRAIAVLTRLATPPDDTTSLTIREAEQLARLLDDAYREIERAEQIRRGTFPGAMSGAEAARFARPGWPRMR